MLLLAAYVATTAIAAPFQQPVDTGSAAIRAAVNPVHGDTTGRHASPASAAPAGPVYNGRAGQFNIAIPRFDTDIPVDGTLDAPVWRQAAVLTGFSQYLPVDGIPSQDSTEVLVWYSPTAIYFGVRAFEIHGAVHAVLGNRDKIDADDNIQIILSPFLHSRQSLVFAANAFGIQEDGTITEGAVASAALGGTQQTSQAGGPPPTDLTPDFVYDSKGQLTPYGYDVVVRIPFRSIKYQAADPQNWGLNVVRKIQHSGYTDTWYPTRLAAASYLQQSGTLVGLTDLHRGTVFDVNPFVTQNAVGSRAASSPEAWRYGIERPQFGSNIRWGITNNLTLNGTYRPDFAEVETDATQLVVDPRDAIQYPEKRPFFLDGLEQFNTPNTLIYTRTITAPIWSTKLTGKIGEMSVAYLGAQDNQGDISAGGGGHPLFNIIRLQQDIGAASTVGIALTDEERGGTYNRMASVDTRLTFGSLYSLTLQAAGSSTHSDTLRGAGPLWDAHFIRAGRTLVLDYNITGIDPEFEAASGFISRTGVTNLNFDNRVTFYPRHTIFETISQDFQYLSTYVYRTFTADGPPEDRLFHFHTVANLHGGWQLQTALFFEYYGYDPTLYANYYLGHISGHDTTYTKFVGRPAIPITDYNVQVTTPQFSKFDLTLQQLYGRDLEFFEWSASDFCLTSMTLDWRPTSQVRAQLMYNATLYWRHSDGTAVSRTMIPRLDLEYQLSRPIFFRLIAQYDAVYQDSLHDDTRTNLPIFFLNPTTGVFTRAARIANNQFQLSGLFAYQPVPGTVAFIGYGNLLEEPQAFHFLTLRRTTDSFFVKFSYLFQL